jgi:hypothetical protein
VKSVSSVQRVRANARLGTVTDAGSRQTFRVSAGCSMQRMRPGLPPLLGAKLARRARYHAVDRLRRTPRSSLPAIRWRPDSLRAPIRPLPSARLGRLTPILSLLHACRSIPARRLHLQGRHDLPACEKAFLGLDGLPPYNVVILTLTVSVVGEEGPCILLLLLGRLGHIPNSRWSSPKEHFVKSRLTLHPPLFPHIYLLTAAPCGRSMYADRGNRQCPHF